MDANYYEQNREFTWFFKVGFFVAITIIIIITSGLVSAVLPSDPQDRWSFNETAQNTIVFMNSLNTSRNLTYGNASGSQGASGLIVQNNSVKLNRTGAWLNLTNTIYSATANNFTMAVWVNGTIGSGYTHMIRVGGLSTGNPGCVAGQGGEFRAGYETTANKWFMISNNAGCASNSDLRSGVEAFPSNTVTHIAIRVRSGRAELWINGALKINDTTTAIRSYTTPTIAIGAPFYDPVGNLQYDELIYYNRTLTDLEMIELANISNYQSTPAPAPDVPVFEYVVPSPANNSVMYYLNGTAPYDYTPYQVLRLATSTQFIPGAVISTFFYNASGHLLVSSSSSGNTSTMFVGNDPGEFNLTAGVYYFNASVTNGTYSAVLDTRKVVIYQITAGAISVPSALQKVNRSLNIVWSNGSTTNQSVAIASYQINLLNGGGSLNRTLGTSTANNLSWNTYQFNLTVGIYQMQVSTIDVRGNSANASVSFNLTSNAILNVTAYDSFNNASVSSLGFNVTDLNTGVMQYFSSALSYIDVDIARFHNYSFLFDVPSFAYAEYNLSTNGSVYQRYNASLIRTNSVSLSIYDEGTLALISNQSVTIYMITNESSQTFNTSNGRLFLANFTPNFYEVKVNSLGYAERSYYINITNRSTQTLNIYLSSSPITLLMTYTDKETGELLEGVGVSVYKIINGSWTSIATGFTDVTGRWQVSVSANTNYRFSSVFTGYDDKTFNLNPVIFTSYTIQLTKIAGTGDELNFANINVYTNNTGFTNNGSVSFLWQISGPSGNLESYGYSLSTQCKNVTAFSGTNAYGGVNSVTFNLSCATLTDYMTLRYNYTLSDGELRSFTYTFAIYGIASDGSFMKNQSEHYGMGLFERVLITVLITIIFAGLIAKFSNIVAGLGAGLLVISYMSYIGFVEWWIIAPTLLVGFVLITSWSTQRS